MIDRLLVSIPVLSYYDWIQKIRLVLFSIKQNVNTLQPHTRQGDCRGYFAPAGL